MCLEAEVQQKTVDSVGKDSNPLSTCALTIRQT